MALEGLGVASSAFAVVSLAGQLADGIQKLVVFWNSVQNAPAEIANLFNELHVLSKLLIRVRENDRSIEFDSLLNDALQDCEKKVVSLQFKVSKAAIDLASKDRGKRSWAALKITIKSKELEAFGKSIERAKITLHMVQTASSYNLALWNREAFEKTAIEVLSIKKTLQQLEAGLLSTEFIRPGPSCEAVTIVRRRGVTKQCLKRTITTPLLQFNTLSRKYQFTTLYGSETVESTQTESNYTVFPSSFLQKLGVSMGIQFTARSTSGWKYTLQPFRAVRPDSLIFDLCRDGDLPGIRRLFVRGDASPYDRDSSGLTPLTVAVRASQLEVAEFLLREGSDPHACDWHYKREPIMDVIDSKGPEFEPKISMINLLLRYRKEDYETSDLLHLIGRFWIGYRPQKQTNMSYIQKQDAQLGIFNVVMPLLQLGDLENIWALEAALTWGCAPELLTWHLQHISGSIDDLQPGHECLYIPHKAINKRIPLRAPFVMKMIIQKTTNLHRCIKASTPTMIALRDRSMFLAWRELLRENGQNIPQFVRQELEDGLLKDAGWTENSLRYIFEANLPPDPHTAPSLRGFPGCERCHIVETDILAHLVTDLKWRRELRKIRRQYQQDILPSTSIDITISSLEKGDNSRLERCGLSLAEDREIELPYRIVCSRPCRDKICVAEAFENNSSEELDLPPFPYKLKDTNLDQSSAKSGKEEDDEEEKDKDPTLDMPGSFKESLPDVSHFFLSIERLDQILI